MQLLLDQGLPRSAVTHLAALGIVAEHVGDLGMAAASDEQILEEAGQRGSVVVSLDSDFHALLAASGASSPSVIRVRIEGVKGDRLAAILQRVMNSATNELRQGAVVSVTTNRIRVRLLPL
ncbi:MAG: DUF5615 family PIN-like protein [Planctomycetales bacterium]|nr:DUF5615 family PIN-like protein [Planctomycetales bacterium]